MKITLEGTMEEIELLALAVATGCQALRGSGADAPHPHEREGN